jgi:hypothetical protein
MADGLLRLLLAVGAPALLTQASAPSRRYLPYIPEFIIPGLMALPLVITNFVAAFERLTSSRKQGAGKADGACAADC